MKFAVLVLCLGLAAVAAAKSARSKVPLVASSQARDIVPDVNWGDAGTYIVYAIGANWKTPTGYKLASLSDVQSKDFADYVNAGKLMDQGETLNDACCLMQIEGGYFIGNSPAPPTYLGAFTQNGNYNCFGTLHNPVLIGTTIGGGMPAPQVFDPITSKIQSNWNVTASFGNNGQYCQQSQSNWAIYVKKGHNPPPPPPGPTPAPGHGGLHFEVYGAGSGFNTPAGYHLASIEELQTEDFIKQVNAGKLMDQGETVAGCCCLAVKGGYLVSKNSPDTYLGAYDNTGSYDCQEVLTNPVYIGSSVNGGLPFPDWLNPLTKDIVSKFTTKSNFDPLYQSGCTAGQPTWGIYVKGSLPPTPPPGPPPVIDPPFIVAGYGKDFKSAPEGYELADLYTIKNKFADFYNAKHLNSTGAAMKGCCVFATYDGFLTVGSPASYIGPYNKNGEFDCEPTLSEPVYIGTENGGQYPNIFAKTVNQTVVDLFSTKKTVDPRLCQDVHNSYAIYMLKKKL